MAFDPHDPSAACRARGKLLATLTERNVPDAEKLNAELVFSELVGNVVRHAAVGAEVEVVIDCSGPQIVLHVADRGAGFRHVSRSASDAYRESGRGLFLTAELTEHFTVSERPGGGSHARAILKGSRA